MGKEYLKDIQISDDISLHLSGAKDSIQVVEGGGIYKQNELDRDRIGRVAYTIDLKKHILYWFDLCIEEEYRYQGIGTKVYRWLEKYLSAEYDIHTIYLVIAQEKSLPFWEKLGFKGIKKELSESSFDV